MLHGKFSIRLGENSSWISDVQYNNAQKWDPPYREFRIHWCPQVIFLNRQYCFLGWGYKKWGLPWWLNGKESTCQCRRCRFNPWIRKIPSRRSSQDLIWIKGNFFFISIKTFVLNYAICYLGTWNREYKKKVSQE